MIVPFGMVRNAPTPAFPDGFEARPRLEAPLSGTVVLLALLAFAAMRGPSASKAAKRRIELLKERHGDAITFNAQAQIRKLMAERASRFEGYASSLIPKPALLRKRLEMTGKEITLGKYAVICLGIAALVTIGLTFRGAPFLLAGLTLLGLVRLAGAAGPGDWR